MKNINEWTATASVKTRGILNSGPAESKMVAVHANWSGLYSLTSKARIINLIRYDNWRNPGLSDLRSATLFATQPQSARPDWHSTAAGSIFAFRPRRARVSKHLPGTKL